MTSSSPPHSRAGVVRHSRRGQLALVSVLQFAEGLTDRQAADAVRARIDFKYCLGLELVDPAFDFSVLSEFRARLIAHGLEEQALDTVLKRLAELGLLRAGGRQRTDATHVLAAVRAVNRLEFVGETMRAALEALAAAVPDWLGKLAWPGGIRPGRSIMGPAATPTGYPKVTTPARSGHGRSARSGSPCWKRCTCQEHHGGCGRFRRCRSCGQHGSSSTTAMVGRCAGGRAKTSRRAGSGS